MSEEKIPKFRSSGRLVLWVRQNYYGNRLSPDRENVFFKCADKNPVLAATHLAEYASFVGKVGSDLEALLLAEPQQLLRYIKTVHSREQEVNPVLVQALKSKGSSSLLYSWANHIKRRLDEDLENALDDGTPQCPKWCYRYSRDVLRGRLPEHLEDVFSKYDDSYHASKYAFDVIRGFAPCRLSDSLHNYMVLKSYQNPNIEHIKVYMDASISDPDVIGNSVAKV